MSLVLRLPHDAWIILTHPLETSHACHRFCNCCNTHTFGSVLISFLTFWLRNVLRATAACTFWISSTSKSAPTMKCFDYFYLEMCFAPQRCALFRHLNFQKCSENENNVFLHFEFARGACNFWSLIWTDVSAPQPNFRTSGATKHWKKLCFAIRDFSIFPRTRIFFLLTLFLLCSSFFFLSLLWLFPLLLLHWSILSEVGLLKLPSANPKWTREILCIWTVRAQNVANTSRKIKSSNFKMLHNAVEMIVSSSKMLQIAREADRTGD